MHKVSATQRMSLPYEELQRLVWDIHEWKNFWSPLEEVHIQYDDGQHQDFEMLVNWQSALARVRTVRFRKSNGDICFFSPQPPPPMAVHQGIWKFSKKDDQYTQLTAVRYFELPFLNNEHLDAYAVRLEKFSLDFSSRLETLLEKIGALCRK